MTKHYCDICGREITDCLRQIDVHLWTNSEHVDVKKATLDVCFSCSIAYHSSLRDFQANFVEKRQNKEGKNDGART